MKNGWELKRVVLSGSFEMWPAQLLVGDTYGFLFPLIATLTGLFLTLSVARLIIGDVDVPVKDLTKHHNWKSAKILSKVPYPSK